MNIQIKILLSCLTFCVATLMTQPVYASENSVELNGKELALTYCTQCHFLPALNKLNSQQWPITIDRMVGKMQKSLERSEVTESSESTEILQPTDEEVAAIKLFIQNKLVNQ